jgi:hypothetical protein
VAKAAEQTLIAASENRGYLPHQSSLFQISPNEMIVKRAWSHSIPAYLMFRVKLPDQPAGGREEPKSPRTRGR